MWPLPCQVPLHLALICRKRAPASESAGRCRERAVTHARAAGQFSQGGRPSQGSGPGPIAGLGGHRLPEQWKRKFWEVRLGHGRGSCPWGAHLLVPTHPDSALTQAPKTYILHPVKGTGAPRKRGPGVTPGPCDSWLWPDPGAWGQLQFPDAPSALEMYIFLQGPWRSPGHRKKGLFLETSFRS